MSKAKENDMWVEKFRPDSIKTMILPRKYKLFFNKFIESDQISNILLYSKSAGSGKCLFYDEQIKVQINEKVYEENKELFED